MVGKLVKSVLTRKKVPGRSYRALLDSLRKVWRIELVADAQAILQHGQPEGELLPTSPLRVTIWNLCKGVGGNLFEHDFRSLCYRSDLILTQEALLSDRGLRGYAQRGFVAWHGASYKRVDGLRDGVMTLAKAPALGDLQRILCKYPEPLLQTPKTSLVSRFALSGTEQELLVINMHSTLVRGKSGAVEEIHHVLDRLPEHQGPVLFGGDFNTFTKGLLRAVESAVKRWDLEFVPVDEDPRAGRAALDQVFVRGLRPIQAVVDTTIKNSDHFPVLYKFELT